MQSIVNCEKISNFVGKYVSKIGTTVCDNNFNVVASSKKEENGLTAIKLATTVIQKFFYVAIKDAIKHQNNRLLLKLLEYLFSILKDTIGLKISAEWLKDKRLCYSYGNKKLGKGILTINTSSAFLCPSMCLGSCKQCANCYAMFSERRHEAELMRNILNQIKLLKYNIDDIINDTIKALGNKKQTLDTNFIRFNANGDILDNEMLIKVNTIALELKARYSNVYGAYTYTHNKRLNLDLATDLVVNESDNDSEDTKATIVLYQWDNKYFDTSKYVLCLGDCSLCPYCKNKDDTRTVIFMAHGGGLNAIETVPQSVIQFYDWLRCFQNEAFIQKCRTGAY